MEILGFNISKAKRFGLEPETEQLPSFVPPTDDTGVSVVSNAGGYYGSYIDFDGTAKTEVELIARYRETSMYPDCDNAIEEICTEAIGAEDDEEVVKLNLDGIDLPKNIKLKLEAAFEEVKTLLEFEVKAHDIFRRWYIDGRLYYHKIIDDKRPQNGIQEMRYVDPRKIKKIREATKKKDRITGVEVITAIQDYYLFSNSLVQVSGQNQPQYTSNGIKIDPASITYVTSGLVDVDKNMVLGHLNKAVKPVNMLKSAEDAMLIYRISRAPTRRVFYIDVGNLPKQKAEQYLKDTMARYRNKVVFDASTGEIKDDRKHMSMLEDFWLPRREGGQGTQIDTLPGAENSNQREDTEYFLNKVYNSMNVPVSRLHPGTTMNFGRQTEITQEELKFAKFISRLRRKFCDLFNDVMRTQCALTGICSPEDWDNIIEPKIKYAFAQDIYWKEAKDLENFRARIELLNEMQELVGVYYSHEYVKKNILKQSDEEIDEMQQQMDAERESRIDNATFQGQLDGAQQAATMEMLPQEPATPAKRKK